LSDLFEISFSFFKKEAPGPGGDAWLYFMPLENNGASMKPKSFKSSRCGRKGRVRFRRDGSL